MNSYGTSEINAPNNSRDHTEKLLKFLKYPIKIKYQKKLKKIIIEGKKKINPISNYRIPSDPSSAAFLIVLAVLTKKSNITIKNVLCNKHRIKYINILKRMGAKIKIFNTIETSNPNFCIKFVVLVVLQQHVGFFLISN